VVRIFRGSPHPACGHVNSLAALLVRPAVFADSKFLSPFPKRLKSPHRMRRRNFFVGCFPGVAPKAFGATPG
jgi:hypothetical protein